MKTPSYRLVLASKSPRRQQLLSELGVEFVVRTKDVPEDYPDELPKTEIARYLAERKARAHQPELAQEEVVLTSDTTVVLDNRLLEKAADADEARSMLQALSGRTHQVITGVCLAGPNRLESFDDTTEVTFRGLTSQEIDYYINTFQPFDKAGAYGIQEWIGMIGVERMVGSYFTVMGLPTHRVYTAIQNWL
ncbi:MAG TPA: septum formation protein Maf [Cytophagales bacterium]|nr:septum formation protein Maf [Cytophagales bacterium]HAP63622.1 septum formation protein Maf [Cytophagales bacterium]